MSMSYDEYPPATLPAPTTWARAAHFRENLSQVTVVPANVEKSKFSPDSPNGRPRPSISHSRMASTSTAFLTKPRDLEDGSDRTEKPSVLSRITAFMLNLRRKGKETVLLPIQQPPRDLPPWPPLHVEKRLCPCEDPKRKKRKRYWIIALIIVLLYLLGNTIALNIRILNMVSSSSSGNGQTSSGGTSSNGNSFALSSDQQQCLSQFTVNAPSNPSSFPCSSCLPLLASVPQSFISTNLQDGQNVQNAIQFCGLQAVFSSADSTGQQGLSNGGWLKDVKFCAWSGVTCGGSGLVSTISLTFPAVPAAIPNELGDLTGLQNFEVIGNGAVPGGSLPGSFSNLTSMTTLHLESTGLSALPDSLFTSLSKVTSLTLVKNGNFGGGLPSSINGLSLQSMVVNGQAITASLSNFFSSTTLQSSLRLLDLSSTGLSTAIPSSIASFNSLVELHLDDNSIQPPLPSAFPSSLQILTLSNNTALSGTLPASLCSSTNLRTCTLTQTGFANTTTCGPCKFT